jgi:hypothetical protein
MTMFERIARAIAASQGHEDWRRCAAAAAAAIAALREPTIEMLEAATSGLPDFGYLPEEWQAMLDHVMSETRA